MRQGLYEAAHNQAGTSAPVFYNYKVDVSGKTGTAEVWDDSVKHYVNYAWYASFAPSNDPKYAVVVMIEKGGHGATTAAPAARMIYDALFHVNSGQFNGNVNGVTESMSDVTCRLARATSGTSTTCSSWRRRGSSSTGSR